MKIADALLKAGFCRDILGKSIVEIDVPTERGVMTLCIQQPSYPCCDLEVFGYHSGFCQGWSHGMDFVDDLELVAAECELVVRTIVSNHNLSIVQHVA